ncbi:SMP-30/gluconolactonase/LRE family protein [Oceanobacillus senegalensis]|uniref:SMP-30/gluconolactonase/LRE family protein n=1 Tax=Oceanobacillus senegalensis TaxID=1936063 RepID=UPI000A30959E|nr:SMP-30/gluconolactonase/LRE family protein [Oceanobacillus senegalensis]
MKAVLPNEHVRATFGEGPLWDDENECLFWVDNAENKIRAYCPKTNQDTFYQLQKSPMSLAKYSKDKLIVIMRDGFYLYHLKQETLKELLKPKDLNEKLLLNDAKCDPQGRLWAGSVNDDFRLYKESQDSLQTEFHGQIASLYRIENLDIKTMKDNITLSNGLDWDPIRNIMYFIDSANQEVVQFDYDTKTGEISNEEVVYRFEESDGLPDGMTIDQEGMLWIALFKGGTVAKIDPFRKKWIDSITVPTNNVTSCAFGGEELRTLFITTSAEPLSEIERVQQPTAGCLFSAELEVGGYKTTRFRGDLKEIFHK